MKLQLKPWLLTVALAASLYGLVMWWVHQSDQALIWSTLQLEVLAIAALLCSVNYVLRGWRWQRWMVLYQRPLPLLQALRFYVAGFVFTPTPGNVGEAVRGMLPRTNPLSASESWSIYAAERLADVMALGLLASPALLLLFAEFPQTAWGASGAWDVWVLLAAFLALVLGLWMLWPVIWLLLNTCGQKFSPKVMAVLDQARKCLMSGSPVWATSTLVAWGCQGAALWFLCRDAQIQLGLITCMGFYALAMIGGALSLLPAGLGGMELILTSLLVAHGADVAAAAQVTVLIRLLTLWLAVALGGVCFLYSSLIEKDISLT